MTKFSVFITTFVFIASCQTTDKKSRDLADAKPITDDTSTADAIDTAVIFGGERLKQAKALIERRKEWDTASKILREKLLSFGEKQATSDAVNTVLLLQGSPEKLDEIYFEKLLQTKLPVIKQAAWQLAAAKPSQSLTPAIERETTRALVANEEDQLFVPQFAAAVQSNKLKGLYTVMRQGLLRTNREAFALAMAHLEPQKASDDFLVYLSTASAEELRQMTLSTIDVYAAMVALSHLQKYQAPLTHPDLGTLFSYAVSRNTVLSDLAFQALEPYFLLSQQNMAQILAREPTWVQIGFVESSRRQMTPVRKAFLTTLLTVSSQKEVIEELREVEK